MRVVGIGLDIAADFRRGVLTDMKRADGFIGRRLGRCLGRHLGVGFGRRHDLFAIAGLRGLGGTTRGRGFALRIRGGLFLIL